MTNSSRVRTVCLLFFGVLILAATSRAQTRPPIAEKIAETYGLDSFGKIDAISYTFNLQLPGVNLSRSWVWQPKTGQVTYEGKDKDGKLVKATYVRSQLNSQPANVKDDIDPNFLNDNYWLLFPLHAYWDTDAAWTDQGMHKLPVGKSSARAGRSEVSRGRRRLLARRHMGTLCRQRLPRQVSCLPPRPAGPRKAERRHGNVGRLQKGRSSADLNGASRLRRRQAPAPLPF